MQINTKEIIKIDNYAGWNEMSVNTQIAFEQIKLKFWNMHYHVRMTAVQPTDEILKLSILSRKIGDIAKNVNLK